MEDIFNDLTKELKINNFEKQSKLKDYITQFQSKIKSICKRSDFPEELNYMCKDFTRKSYIYYSNIDEKTNRKIEITSAGDNGQSVSVKTTAPITADDVDLNKYVNKNIREISNYAYMGW